MTSHHKPNSMLSSGDAQRVLELADKIFSNHNSSEDMTELESLLSASPHLRRIYLQYALVHSQLALTATGLSGNIPLNQHTVSLSSSLATRTPRIYRAIAASLAAVLLISLGTYLFNRTPSEPRSTPDFTNASERADAPKLPTPSGEQSPIEMHYDTRTLPSRIIGVLVSDRSRNISSTTLNVLQGATELLTAEGIDLQIEGPAKFGASTNSAGVLFHGSVLANSTQPNTGYSIETYGLRVQDRGAEFRVTTIEQNLVHVEAIVGDVEVQSRIRKPLFLWSFDELESMTKSDSASNSQLTIRNVEHVPGLVGNGALAFNNQNDSSVRIHAGTGTEIGSGIMACSSGVSIEAIVISHWDGKDLNYDEIFRKEDGVHRMLLSFQNDGSPHDLETPKVPPGPCLSFGLHLDQHGYSELDMPLDGNDGRPSLLDLTDGKPHHIVATYDCFTGRKSIFIDGRLRFFHDFADGTLILNGGPAMAEIGNHNQFEPFTGTIDEVAYYDFALTHEEILSHYERSMRGLPYDERQSDAPDQNRWQTISIVQAGATQVFDPTKHNFCVENPDGDQH